MRPLRDLFLGLITTLASTIVVIGAILLTLVQGPEFQIPTRAPDSVDLTPSVTPLPTDTSAPGVTPLPSTATLTPTDTVEPAAEAPTTCPRPAGWDAYTIQSGDSLDSLARRANVSKQTIKEQNCLIIETLLPGTILYLPRFAPTASPTPPLVMTATQIPCGPPFGWITYIVQPGDTLFRLSLSYNVSVPQLQLANCLGSSTYIRYGQPLFVPNVRTNTPVVTLTFTNTPRPTNTPTTPLVKTNTPTATWTVAPPASTSTFTPTTAPPTSTHTVTNTPVPSATFTTAPTATFTPTLEPTATPTNEGGGGT